MRDWDSWRHRKNKKIAMIRAKESSKDRQGEKCRDCGLYGCVCNISLYESLQVWKKKRIQDLKEKFSDSEYNTE